MYIETSRPIAIKFYLKHHWDGRKAAQIGSELLVSMATHSSHMVKKGKCCYHFSALIFDWIFIILAGNEDSPKILTKFDFGPDDTLHCGVTCP